MSSHSVVTRSKGQRSSTTSSGKIQSLLICVTHIMCVVRSCNVIYFFENIWFETCSFSGEKRMNWIYNASRQLQCRQWPCLHCPGYALVPLQMNAFSLTHITCVCICHTILFQKQCIKMTGMVCPGLGLGAPLLQIFSIVDFLKKTFAMEPAAFFTKR